MQEKKLLFRDKVLQEVKAQHDLIIHNRIIPSNLCIYAKKQAYLLLVLWLLGSIIVIILSIFINHLLIVCLGLLNAMALIALYQLFTGRHLAAIREEMLSVNHNLLKIVVFAFIGALLAIGEYFVILSF